MTFPDPVLQPHKYYLQSQKKKNNNPNKNIPPPTKPLRGRYYSYFTR